MRSFDIGAEHWPVLSRLLDEALELPPDARPAWLARLPAECQPVKSALERLLARASEVLSSGFLEALPGPETRAAAAAGLAAPTAGEQIGPWLLARPLGEGGMASVWLAERADGLLGRPVALKLPSEGLRRGLLAERLAREREILATLNHPHIARLLDAGITPAGQPYLALEYVEGRHIDEYCRERRLGVKSRLHLFLQIASALAHAHAMLVVHRDLKPSNILVTAEGQVRLLDFGIAKILDGGETRETELTRVSGHALTLDYASPEQVAGRAVTVASDVYSLGVVLYELLSGTRPYQPKRDSRAALEDAILEMEPRPPSERVADKALARSLRGDLDIVVLKALKKNPAERYSTAEAFAEDVRRHLQSRPVRARPDHAWYRLTKFVRRHHIAAGAAVAAVLILVAGSALIAWQARIAFAERRRSEEAKKFLVSILMDAHTYWAGRPLTALDLLKRAQRRVDQLNNADRETRVELLNILGAGLLSLQDTQAAESTLAAAVKAAAGLPQAHPQALRARLLNIWVRFFRGRTAALRGEIDDLLRAMQNSPRTLPEDLAAALRARSDLAFEEGEPRAALGFAREALRFAEAQLGPRHNQTVLALVSLTLAHQLSGNAAVAVEQGARGRRRALEAYAGLATHPNVLKARMAYGQALAAAGDPASGIAETRLVVEDATALFGPASRQVGLFMRTLARLQLDAGQLPAALQSVDGSLAILDRHFDRESPGFGSLLQLRGRILLAARNYAEALPDLARSEQIAARAFGPADSHTLRARSCHAMALARTGRLREAQWILQSVLSGAGAAPDPDGWARHYLGIVSRLDGKPDAALQLQRAVLSATERDARLESLRMPATVELGLDHLALGNISAAAGTLRPVVDWCRRTDRQATPDCAEALAGWKRAGRR